MFSPFDDAFDSLSFQSGRSYLNFFWPHRLILAGGRPNGPETRISIRNRGNNRRRQMKLLSVISTSAFDGVLRVFASNAFLLMEGTRKTNLTTRKEIKKKKKKILGSSKQHQLGPALVMNESMKSRLFSFSRPVSHYKLLPQSDAMQQNIWLPRRSRAKRRYIDDGHHNHQQSVPSH